MAGCPVETPAGRRGRRFAGAHDASASWTFPIAKAFVERVVLVDDEDILRAQATLWDAARIVAEPGGATAMAALLSGVVPAGAGERVAVIVCGGMKKP